MMSARSRRNKALSVSLLVVKSLLQGSPASLEAVCERVETIFPSLDNGQLSSAKLRNKCREVVSSLYDIGIIKRNDEGFFIPPRQ